MSCCVGAKESVDAYTLALQILFVSAKMKSVRRMYRNVFISIIEKRIPMQD